MFSPYIDEASAQMLSPRRGTSHNVQPRPETSLFFQCRQVTSLYFQCRQVTSLYFQCRQVTSLYFQCRQVISLYFQCHQSIFSVSIVQHYFIHFITNQNSSSQINTTFHVVHIIYVESPDKNIVFD